MSGENLILVFFFTNHAGEIKVRINTDFWEDLQNKCCPISILISTSVVYQLHMTNLSHPSNFFYQQRYFSTA